MKYPQDFTPFDGNALSSNEIDKLIQDALVSGEATTLGTGDTMIEVDEGGNITVMLTREPLIIIAENEGKRYEVNTVGMGGMAQLLNPLMSLRNEMFGIRGCAETMIWELEPNNERKDPILHCQRYHKFSAAVKNHYKIARRIERGETKFFNGDGMPHSRGEGKE